MTIWFTVQLDDKPGSLARVAAALAERNVNITGIVGVAEDTDGALMLTTSDAAATAEAFAAIGLRTRSTTRPAASSRPGCRSRTSATAAGRRSPCLDVPRCRPPSRSASPWTTVPSAVPGLLERVGAAGGMLRTLSTVRWLEPRVEGGRVASTSRSRSRGSTRRRSSAPSTGPGLRAQRLTRSLDRIFGKRVIVVGGGAQVAQVALGAVSEADRHNLRGERISVDTIALVGEENIAAAVRAVADLPRARLLVLAGSIMGGDITRAARELQETGIPVIALNMAGSITDVADLVVSDPVQAGTMAVMAIADTATFDLARQRGRRF